MPITRFRTRASSLTDLIDQIDGTPFGQVGPLLDKVMRRAAAAEAALEQCAEYFRARSDVVDGDYGQPAPNEEMSLLTEIEEALGKGGY